MMTILYKNINGKISSVKVERVTEVRMDVFNVLIKEGNIIVAIILNETRYNFGGLEPIEQLYCTSDANKHDLHQENDYQSDGRYLPILEKKLMLSGDIPTTIDFQATTVNYPNTAPPVGTEVYDKMLNHTGYFRFPQVGDKIIEDVGLYSGFMEDGRHISIANGEVVLITEFAGGGK